MPLYIVENDITKMEVDAVVNAANNRLARGGGVCGAIFSAAGADRLEEECRRIGFCETGRAVTTGGYGLAAKHIIHTVGPVWQGGGHGEEALLKSCYQSSLALAADMGCTSVAFPLISSGIFGYPKDKALEAAIGAIRAFIAGHDMSVYLVLFDKAACELGNEMLKSAESRRDAGEPGKG